MDLPTLDRRLQQAEDLVSRMEKNIVFQRRMIATLDRGGHDVSAAKMFLGGWRLPARNTSLTWIDCSRNWRTAHGASLAAARKLLG